MTEKILQQGAEANIILVEPKSGEPFIIKNRIKKGYRLPKIDNEIRFRRTRAEAKLLEKSSHIINCPKPFFEPSIKESSKLKMPYIDGKKLSDSLDSFPLEKQKEICRQIGENIARLHDANIIHGDLTTSNMILVENIVDEKEVNNNRSNKDYNNSSIKLKASSGWGGGMDNNQNKFKIYFIDFGLGFQSHKTEDKAVDLHLLRQALEAKHFRHWQILFAEVLKGYESSKNHNLVLQQLKKVEARGRYKERY